MSEGAPQPPSAVAVVVGIAAVVGLALLLPMLYCCLMYFHRQFFTSAPTSPAELINTSGKKGISSAVVMNSDTQPEAEEEPGTDVVYCFLVAVFHHRQQELFHRDV